jgi:two-component system C4-dicarboxylate transport sensor histidine kinase DctB
MRSLFIPFTTTKPTGLGLGLVISHDIVAEFGGTFVAENTGAGACLTITLPRAT